jgi:hypothetical protein
LRREGKSPLFEGEGTVGERRLMPIVAFALQHLPHPLESRRSRLATVTEVANTPTLATLAGTSSSLSPSENEVLKSAISPVEQINSRTVKEALYPS